MGLLLLLLGPKPPEFHPDVPLPWDMAHHSVRAELFARGLVDRDFGALARESRYWDVYPPAAYALAGLQLAVTGGGVGAMPALTLWYPLLLALAGVLLFRPTGDRYHEATGACLVVGLTLALGQWHALARLPMLDTLAATVALLALAALAAWAARPSGRRLFLAGGLLLLAALVKYNVGLVAIAAGAILLAGPWAPAGRRPRMAVALVLLAATLAWAAWLSWQDHGWHSFLAFAQNRSNSAGMGFVERLGEYFALFARTNFGSPALALLPAGLALASLRWWRQRAVALLWAYLLLQLVALGRHSYVLDRNLVAAATTLCALAALGAVAWLPQAGRGRALALVAALLFPTGLLLANSGRIEAYQARSLHAGQAELAGLSEAVGSVARRSPSLRVCGSFNRFPAPWVRLLWLRAGHRDTGGLSFELGGDIAGGREGIDAGWDPGYERAVDSWLRHPDAKDVLAIFPQAASRWQDLDYRLWNAWKRQPMGVLMRHPRVTLRSESSVAGGTIRVAWLQTGTPAPEFGPGWWPDEGWGRWAIPGESRLPVELPATADSVIVRWMLPPAGVAKVELSGGGRSLGWLQADGDALAWRRSAFALPEGLPGRQIELVFRSGRGGSTVDGREVGFGLGRVDTPIPWGASDAPSHTVARATASGRTTPR